MPRLSLLGLGRTAGVLLGALLVATVLPRFGIPARYLPDLVVILVAATAVVRGPSHGALVGLAAGWVVDLMPPGGSPLGATALVYAAAGALAGTFHRAVTRGMIAPLAALVTAAAAVQLGHACLAILGDGTLDPAGSGSRLAVTVVVGLAAVPAILGVDRVLTRRRLA